MYQDLYFYNFKIGTVITLVDPELWHDPKWCPECKLARCLRAPAGAIDDAGRLIHFYARELFRWCGGDGDAKGKIDTITEIVNWTGHLCFSCPDKFPVQIKYPGEEGMPLGTLVKVKGGIKFERVDNRVSNLMDTFFRAQTKDHSGIAESFYFAELKALVAFRELVKSNMWS